MIIKDYTLKLLNFQEKNIVIKKFELVNDVYYVYIDQIKDVNLPCNKCGVVQLLIISITQERLNIRL